MKSTTQTVPASRRIDESAESPFTDALTRYLADRGYAPHTISSYVGHAGDFLQWTKQSRLDLPRISEAVVAEFLDDYSSHKPGRRRTRSDPREAHAAIGHLLVVLRTLGVVPPRQVIATPVEVELRHFDDYMENVRGLAPRTRRSVLRVVREFLAKRFGDRPVVFSAIKPEYVRRCFVRLTERCRSPLSTGAVVSALRGYFRFRATCGDAVYGLSGVLSYPANWQQAAPDRSPPCLI